MRAQETGFLEVLGQDGVQFIVPIFQRVYSWKPHECEELFDDVMASGREGRQHFMGTFLCSRCAEGDDGTAVLQVIDGQQRATTVTLMLMAFADGLLSKGDEGEERAQGIFDRYLTCEAHPDGSPDAVIEPKLLLTSTDDDMLAFLLGLQDAPQDLSTRLQENLDMLKARMSGSTFDADAFWAGMESLRVIAIELDAHDSPQEVFESLNSKGKRLAVEDLIRNAILSSTTDPDDALALYEQRWLPLEQMVEDTPGVEMEDVLCSWIASNHKDVYLDSKSEVYPLFKSDLERKYKGDCRKLVSSIKPYASMFVSDDQWRRDRLYELDRWLQGKPRNLISERRVFGD